jgi:adenylate cyclase
VILAFGDHRLDIERRELRRGGDIIDLEPKAFDLLAFLVLHRDRVVTKDDLLQGVWGGRIVSESALTTRINAVRRALGDDGATQRLVRTFTRKGVRFVGEVTEKSGTASPAVGDLPSRFPAAADRPSIAVLPFQNMSADPEQEFFADGIAEDVITALARYPSLFVIARNSSFIYKGRTVDVKEIGRELGVRYVLEGSLRKSGTRVRVTAQLVEAETGRHVWADRYDRDLADIFAVQDDITEKVTIAVAPAIADAELHRAMRKPPESLDAWAAYQRGLWHLDKATTDDNTLAEGFFQRAINLDPDFADGYCGLAVALMRAVSHFQTRGLSDIPNLAEPLARKAVALDGNNAVARAWLSYVLYMRGDYQGGVAEANNALALSPNLALGYWRRASALIFSGRSQEGLADLRMSLRLEPLGASLAQRLTQVAVSHYFSRAYEETVETAKQAIRLFPDFPPPRPYLAAALGQLGRTEEATAALAHAIVIAAHWFDMYVRNRPPWWRPEDRVHVIDGLRKAGWRET